MMHRDVMVGGCKISIFWAVVMLLSPRSFLNVLPKESVLRSRHIAQPTHCAAATLRSPNFGGVRTATVPKESSSFRARSRLFFPSYFSVPSLWYMFPRNVILEPFLFSWSWLVNKSLLLHQFFFPFKYPSSNIIRLSPQCSPTTNFYWNISSSFSSVL
jgi:hypothetical protein